MPGPDPASRTLTDYVAILRRRWWLAVAVFVITILAAAVVTFRQPEMYRASSKIVIGQQGGAFQLNVGNVADQFTLTMGDLIRSEVVAQQVIDTLALDLDPATLLGNLAVSTKPSTSVLTVTYDDTDPLRAVHILDEVGRAFTRLVEDRLAAPVSEVERNVAVSATVFDEAHLLPGPVQPKPLRNMAVAGVLGVLLGLLAVVFREQFDGTVRSVEQAERAFGQAATIALPPNIVGFNPFDRVGRRRRDPVLTELSIQMLKAGIQWPGDADEPQTILVTSSNPEEGKSTIAANLAMVMTTQGHNVIIVDADLRHAMLHRYLGMGVDEHAITIDRIMAGQATAAEAMIDVPIPAGLFSQVDQDAMLGPMSLRSQSRAPGRLRAILAGPGRSSVGEFTLADTAAVLAELRGMADFVIVDSPPLLVVPDAYPFVANVDIVLALVRAGRSSARAVETLSRTLQRLRARRVELVVTESEDSLTRTTYYGYRPAPPASGGGNGQPRQPAPSRRPVPGRLSASGLNPPEPGGS